MAANPAAHSIPGALSAFDEPYWPRPMHAGAYRPVTILSYAIDWTLSGGRPGWFHVANALWHAVTVVLLVLVLTRWLPQGAALLGGLVFAVHPVHVEAVAGVVGRADLLASAGILGSVLAARYRAWMLALALAGLAMLSKEYGVVAGMAVLLDDRLGSGPARLGYPGRFYAGMAALTAAYVVVWAAVGREAAADVAAPFLTASALGRVGISLAAIARAGMVLALPLDLTADYSPQVIPVPARLSFSTSIGALLVIALPLAAFGLRRKMPGLSFTLLVGAATYLPTSNLLFPSGVVLSERNLYLAAAIPAVGVAYAWTFGARWGSVGRRWRFAAAALLVSALGLRSVLRLPSWRDNKSFLLTLLEDHHESYRAHFSAAGVLAGIGDTAGAERHYELADSLFPGDPQLVGSHAQFLLDIGDTADAARLFLRMRFLQASARRDRPLALAVADSARARFPQERSWYDRQLKPGFRVTAAP